MSGTCYLNSLLVNLPLGYRKRGKTQPVSIHFPHNNRENSEYVRDVHLVMLSSSPESEEEEEEERIGTEDDRYISSHEEGSLDKLAEYGIEAFTFTNLDSLINISLCSKGLIRLSRNIGHLSNSHYFQLCCNKLRTVPLEIGYLQQLTILDLSNNQIETLPETLGLLTALVELKLSDNKLRTLPRSMAALTQLSVLRLNNNSFQEIPRLVGHLTNLVNLDVANNNIKYLPAEITRLPFLRRIWVDDCPLITEIDSFTCQPSSSPQSLLEASARSIIRNRLPVHKYAPKRILNYLQSAKTCTYCGGPFFEYSVIRARMLEKNDQAIPIVYYLCEAHWNTDAERVKLLFCQRAGNSHRTYANSTKKKKGSQRSDSDSSIPQLPPLPSHSSRFSTLIAGRRLLRKSPLLQNQSHANPGGGNLTMAATTEFVA
ncbi:L domain-like protein [Basidiobolus meristosporus CBS 931.73]|uniref:L domain-like protein n=1 Tax=Basidiobolus meristosporus CBS 931.73 TaxID=1314790 RepID=A0A1Y1XXL2_9FUNG|nr:L domain-like protein [Basidiobolus meristosporus CBS 931.73]|eukprot:ORX90487.1 L domain-like protein [Basidiobolus meristosporus CBS 931.73]